jgi:hypothetical protein
MTDRMIPVIIAGRRFHASTMIATTSPSEIPPR